MYFRHKIFVSYKHQDSDVAPLRDFHLGTARDYVDCLILNQLAGHIYKGEGNEDISPLNDEVIKRHLSDKIFDSTITLILISPNIKEHGVSEKRQWMPWEISYSMKGISRNGYTSHTNAVLAVILPDRDWSYSYFYQSCEHNTVCTVVRPNQDLLFQIITDNIHNSCFEMPNSGFTCKFCFSSCKASYIHYTTWHEFTKNPGYFFRIAQSNQRYSNSFKIVKELT